MDVGGFRSRLWRYIKAPLLHRQGRPLGVLLVAEKSDGLRRKVVDTLRARCYETLEASNGAEAVRIGASYLGEIDLLLTDVQLTDFSGWDLAEILRLDHPRLKVLFLSPAERVARPSLSWQVLRFARLGGTHSGPAVPQAVLDEIASIPGGA